MTGRWDTASGRGFEASPPGASEPLGKALRRVAGHATRRMHADLREERLAIGVFIPQLTNGMKRLAKPVEQHVDHRQQSHHAVEAAAARGGDSSEHSTRT